ncbi:MAG: transporter substrate-binding domain-containing protein [Aquihabitans sp.]
MRRSTKHPFLVSGLAVALMFGAVACGSDSDGGDAAGSKSTTTVANDGANPRLAELAGKRIGVQSDTTGKDYADENKPEGAEVVAFDDTVGLFGALASGDIDAILQDFPVNAYRTIADDTVEVVETYKTDEQYGFAVKKGSDLKGELDEALAAMKDDGTYDLIFAKYFPEDGKAGPGPEASDVDGSRTLKVCSDIPYPPMEMEGEGPRGLAYTGFDIELLDAMAASIDANLEILAVGFDGILGNLASGSCDVVASSVTITEERAQEVDFTEPYFDADQSLLIIKS